MSSQIKRWRAKAVATKLLSKRKYKRTMPGTSIDASTILLWLKITVFWGNSEWVSHVRFDPHGYAMGKTLSKNVEHIQLSGEETCLIQ